MNTQLCAIKGSRDGLVVTISDAARFAEVLTALEEQLIASESFFQGSTVKLLVRQGTLSPSQLDQIERIITRYGMNLDRQPPSWGLTAAAREAPVPAARSEVEHNTLLVKRTIRSGQRLHYDGNVVVMGDVNPGAEVVCTGDILVLGSLRGVAHAGAEGKTDAIVFAFRLEPTQLRIAHVISRAPDEKLPQPQGPEIARVVGIAFSCQFTTTKGLRGGTGMGKVIVITSGKGGSRQDDNQLPIGTGLQPWGRKCACGYRYRPEEPGCGYGPGEQIVYDLPDVRRPVPSAASADQGQAVRRPLSTPAAPSRPGKDAGHPEQ